MKSNKYCRRSFLKRLGLSSMMLPILDTEFEGVARAAPVTPAKRFATMYWPNGVNADYWPKNKDENNFEMTDTMSPLVPHRADLLILEGMELSAASERKTAGHEALHSILTGDFGVQGDNVGNAISLDRHLAKSQTTEFKSLVLGVHNEIDNRAVFRYVSFDGPAVGDQPNAPEVQDDVHKTFKLLFSTPGGGMDGQTLERVRLERKSVFDFVKNDIERFRRRLGTESQQKIELHLGAVRKLEERLDRIPIMNDSYVAKPPNPAIDSYRVKDFDLVARAQIDMMVGAFASGKTNIATQMLSNAANDGWVFHWLGTEFGEPGTGEGGFNKLRNHHEIGHLADQGPDNRRRHNMVNKYFHALFASFIDGCKQYKEQGKPMLDNCVLWLVNNMNQGGYHQTIGVPTMLAGKCGGYFRTGRYIRTGDDISNNRILVSIGNAMGDPMRTFGQAKWGGALPELR
jgi:Protein of unknown function (DUF1552)